MELNQLGEFGLIDLIQIPHYAPESVLVGIGDDCAVLSFDESRYQVASCDLLVEDVHFIRGQITPYQIGYKSVAVNLSDVAAMGGKPDHILLSVAVPTDYTVAEWQEFYRGVHDICRKYCVNVIGGDTTSGKEKLTVNVTVLGTVDKQYLHLRSDAKPGDVVFVTGPLGGSRAGLELVGNPQIDIAEETKQSLLKCHYQPEPCCIEIQALNRLAGDALHGLNDISDGLVSECNELADASHVSIVLDLAAVPVNSAALELAAKIEADGRTWALTGGEDYQLVGTMDAGKASEICAAYKAETGKEIIIVGKVTSGSGVYLQNGTECQKVEKKGYNHFTNAQSVEQIPQKDGIVEQLLAQIARMKEQEEAQAVYRHDWKNHLSCVLGLLESGETELAGTYLRNMLQNVPQQKMQPYHSREILNVLCNQKEQLAKIKGIEFQFHTADPNIDLLAHITDYDLCTLLGNLLDNGLEHTANVEDPYLYLDLFEDREGNVVLRMENSCQVPPVLRNGLLESCKADSGAHGKGMGQIKRITEAYGGVFSWQYDSERECFITRCLFPVNN